MIQLTRLHDGNPIWINPEKITYIWNARKNENRAGILSVGEDSEKDAVVLAESPEEVARMVLEYKLAMERYKVGLSLEKPHLWDSEQDKLFTLAGLETSAEKAARELLAGLEDTNDGRL